MSRQSRFKKAWHSFMPSPPCQRLHQLLGVPVWLKIFRTAGARFCHYAPTFDTFPGSLPLILVTHARTAEHHISVSCPVLAKYAQVRKFGFCTYPCHVDKPLNYKNFYRCLWYYERHRCAFRCSIVYFIATAMILSYAFCCNSLEVGRESRKSA